MDDKVEHSCGCVLCDMGLEPIRAMIGVTKNEIAFVHPVTNDIVRCERRLSPER
jgi:hypothetical protein